MSPAVGHYVRGKMQTHTTALKEMLESTLVEAQKESRMSRRSPSPSPKV